MVIDMMIEHSLIPEFGDFEITEILLYQMGRLYASLGNGIVNQSSLHSRKFSGLSLLNLKLSRGIKPSDMKEGLIYLITNPAWPEYTKVGITTNLDNRLSTYQTSDPLRLYKLSGFEFVIDRRKTEKIIHDAFSVHIERGEWLKNSSRDDLIRSIRDQINCLPIYTRYIDDDNSKLVVGDTVAFYTTKLGYQAGKIVGFTCRSVNVERAGRVIGLAMDRVVKINGKYNKRILKKILTRKTI